ncbi:MAG: DNA-binding response regulator [Alphaproteobacteria bacterium]|nr:DNA-binding response regulator [Alphaproteobacteria bacterium]
MGEQPKMNQRSITVVLADDHRMVREALVPFVRRIGERVIVLEAGSLDEVIELISRPEQDIDLVILDLYMPGMNGPGGLRRVREVRPQTPVAVLSGSVHSQDIEGALDAGAAGYLPKTMVGAAFVNALSLVLNGERFVPSEFYLGLRDRGPHMAAGEGEAGGDRAPVGLTSRQWAVLRELVAGRSNKEIAKILGIEEITVKVHLQAVFKRLQVSNRTQAATYAMQRGWFNNRTAQRGDIAPS